MLGLVGTVDAAHLLEISIAVIVLLDTREPSVNKVSRCQMKYFRSQLGYPRQIVRQETW